MASHYVSAQVVFVVVGNRFCFRQRTPFVTDSNETVPNLSGTNNFIYSEDYRMKHRAHADGANEQEAGNDTLPIISTSGKLAERMFCNSDKRVEWAMVRKKCPKLATTVCFQHDHATARRRHNIFDSSRLTTR